MAMYHTSLARRSTTRPLRGGAMLGMRQKDIEFVLLIDYSVVHD